MSMPIADALVKPGEAAMFYCSADGVPYPSYLWYINGVPLEGRLITYSNAHINIKIWGQYFLYTGIKKRHFSLTSPRFYVAKSSWI